MNRSQLSKFLVVLIATLMLIITGCAKAVTINTNPEDAAPDFELDQLNGETMTLADTDGKVRLVYFYFSHCETGCIPATFFLSKVQDQLKEKGVFGSEVEFLSITFDPERDTTERLQEFAKLNNADTTGWHFLRSEVDYTRELASQYNIAVVDLEDGQFAHSNVVLVVNQEGFLEDKYFPVANLDNITSDEVVDYVMNLLKYKG